MPLPQFPLELENKTWQRKTNKQAGETGIGAKLDELAASYKRINLDAFTSLENARSQGELEQWTPRGDAEFAKVQATAKAVREFSLFAPRKAAELSKTKTFPKDTLKLIEQLARVAETFDVELVQTATDIRKQAAERLAGHARQEAEARQQARQQAGAARPQSDAPQQENAPQQGEARRRLRGRLPEKDLDLAAQFRRLDATPAEDPFHFVLACGKVSGLVLSRTPITIGHRIEAKEMRKGQGRIVMGTCHSEGIIYVFTMSEGEKPIPGLAGKIARAAMMHARRRIRVKVRGGGVELDDGTDPEDVADTGAPADDPQAFKAELVQRVRDFTEEVKTHPSSDPALDAALRKRLTDAVMLLKGDKMDECELALAEIETDLDPLREAR
jgi:hypothetical protein